MPRTVDESTMFTIPYEAPRCSPMSGCVRRDTCQVTQRPPGNSAGQEVRDGVVLRHGATCGFRTRRRRHR